MGLSVVLLLSVYFYNVYQNTAWGKIARSACDVLTLHPLSEAMGSEAAETMFGGDAQAIDRDWIEDQKQLCAALADRLSPWKWSLASSWVAPYDSDRRHRLSDAVERAAKNCFPALAGEALQIQKMFGAKKPALTAEITLKIKENCDGIRTFGRGLGMTDSTALLARKVWDWPLLLKIQAEIILQMEKRTTAH